MRQTNLLLMGAALFGLAAVPGRAAEIKVVANASIAGSSVSSDDLKRVFLATKTILSDGSHVEPVLLKSGPAHEAFIKQYLGKTAAALESYYRGLVFTGRGFMPKTVASEAELVDLVSKTKGAIGYVSAKTGTGNTNVIEVK